MSEDVAHVQQTTERFFGPPAFLFNLLIDLLAVSYVSRFLSHQSIRV